MVPGRVVGPGSLSSLSALRLRQRLSCRLSPRVSPGLSSRICWRQPSASNASRGRKPPEQQHLCQAGQLRQGGIDPGPRHAPATDGGSRSREQRLFGQERQRLSQKRQRQLGQERFRRLVEDRFAINRRPQPPVDGFAALDGVPALNPTVNRGASLDPTVDRFETFDRIATFFNREHALDESVEQGLQCATTRQLPIPAVQQHRAIDESVGRNVPRWRRPKAVRRSLDGPRRNEGSVAPSGARRCY